MCVDCVHSDLYHSTNDLETHIASEHLKIYPYECEKCKHAKFPTEHTLINHCLNDHGLHEFVIKYRYTEELAMQRKELGLKLNQCYAMSRSMLTDPRLHDQLSNGVDGRVKMENGDLPILPTLHQTPATIYTDNNTMQQYHNFLDETLNRHEEEKTVAATELTNGCGPIKPKVQIQCQLCQDIVSKQRSSMVYHANTRHGKYELYECGICHRKWQTIAKSDVIKHIRSHHERDDGSIDESMVIDYRKSLGNKLKEITDKCFPEKKKQRIGYTDATDSTQE